jgi:small conductance mechanosensitive channel
MDKLLEKLNDLWVNAGIKLVYVLVILFVGGKLIKLIIKLISKSRVYKKLDKSVASFLLSFTKAALNILLLVIMAGVIGIPSASIVALIGSAGVAIGLAMQGGLSNIAGGLVILIFKPFKVGDFIDTHTDAGVVTNISLFYTTLLTVDNRTVSIPNGNLANQSSINFSNQPERRLDISIDVSYNNKIDDVKKSIDSVISKEKRIDKEKDVFVRLTNYKESSMEYTIRVWVNKDDYWNTKFDLLENLKNKFDQDGIIIPYNQLDIHIDKG